MYVAYNMTSKRWGQSQTALQRYDRPSVLSPKITKYYELAGVWLEKEFGPYLENSRVLLYDNARDWIKTDTSAGLPWTQKYATKNDYYLSEHAHFFSEYYERLATDDPIRSLCSVTEKIELRPIEKIRAGQVRTTISIDTNHLTAAHMLCHDMDEKLKDSHEDHPIKLGMNMFEGGFDRLHRWMTPFGEGPNTLALDGKMFDSTIKPIHFEQIAKFRCKMLCPRDATHDNFMRIRNLYRELMRAPFVDVDGYVYGRDCGGPSGHKSTTVDNSLKNYMDVCVMYMIITGDTCYENFKKFVRMCIVGDDLNITVHPRLQATFNHRTIAAASEQIGMVYHFEADKFLPNECCAFLGHEYRRCFVPHLGYEMLFPCINGHKMRCSLVHHNELQTVENTIVRACALRAETFPDETERAWFAKFITHLRGLYKPSDHAYAKAWTNYKTDTELWILYSGIGLF